MEQKPRNIFELINLNVCDMSKDLCQIALRVQKIEQRLDDLFAVTADNENVGIAQKSEENAN